MSSPVDPYDELTALYLTEADEPAAPAPPHPTPPNPGPPTRVRPEVELVVVGHLPVRASLWLTPYADALSRELGTSALIRLEGEVAGLEVVRGGDDVPPLERFADLPAAIRAIAPFVRRWVVRPPVRAETEELLAATPDRITVLSSGNGAAVANSYRLIKNLVTTASSGGWLLPELGLAVMGADEDRAKDVADNVDRTARHFLDVPVSLVLGLPRMDAGIRVTAARTFPGHARPSMREVIGWIESGREPQPGGRSKPEPETPALAPEPESDPTPAELDWLTPGPSAPPRERVSAASPAVSEPPTPPEPAATPPHLGRHMDSVSEWPPGRPVARIKLTPRPGLDVEPKETAGIREPHEEGLPVPLAGYVPGLTPIAPRCPEHERVELAVDARGGVHLLGREDTVREMRVVERWAVAHRELLAMACPDQVFTPGEPVTCHLFASEPIRVADLHASDLHLHVLAPVDVDGKRGWYAAPLK